MAEDIFSDATSALRALRASRQKSCNACVKAKRACDKLYPFCSRCEQKGVLCVYGKRTHGEAFDESFGFEQTGIDLSWDGLVAFSSLIDDNPNSLASTMLPLETPRGTFMPFMEFSGNSSGSMQMISFQEEQIEKEQETGVQNGVQNGQELSEFDYAPMADICQDYEPWQVYNPNSKAHYIVQTIKSYPTNFATDNRTPWMHRHLYDEHMPSSIQSCFTACTLYSNMTDSNKTSVFRVLFQNLSELKEVPALTSIDKLARLQALFLYQIICLFDGDVTLRSLADRNMLLLQDWADDLCKIRENIGPAEAESGISKAVPVPSSWERWMFAETVRRTVLGVYIFLGMWTVMSRNDADVLGAWKHLHYWTVSRPLWEAPSSFKFFLTWKETPHFVAANFEVGNLLKNARGDDIDEFSKLTIVIAVGLDTTKQWFMDRGSVFRCTNIA